MSGAKRLGERGVYGVRRFAPMLPYAASLSSSATFSLTSKYSLPCDLLCVLRLYVLADYSLAPSHLELDESLRLQQLLLVPFLHVKPGVLEAAPVRDRVVVDGLRGVRGGIGR